jgi:hypothetical protein
MRHRRLDFPRVAGDDSEFRKMRMLAAAAVSALSLALTSASALAFSDEPAPDGPSAQSQFSDPDEAVDNLADTAQGGAGTAVSTGDQIPSNSAADSPAPATAQDAEPVNPAWPAWMVWHQQ